MATPYFDWNTQAAKNMLPPTYRGDPELANAAPLSEAMVIGYYTMNPPYFFYTAASVANVSQWIWPSTERGGGVDISNQNAPSTGTVAMLRVYLTGYTVDAADSAVDPNLKLALQYTIADVVAWTLNRWKNIEAGLQSSSGVGTGGQPRSKSFRPYSEEAFPPSWNWRLQVYDSRPVNWAL
jgi:hypothetical protein